MSALRRQSVLTSLKVAHKVRPGAYPPESHVIFDVGLPCLFAMVLANFTTANLESAKSSSRLSAE